MERRNGDRRHGMTSEVHAVPGKGGGKGVSEEKSEDAAEGGESIMQVWWKVRAT